MGLFADLFDSASGFNSYMPPKGYMIDYNLQSLDRVKNHLSNAEVKRRTMQGKYNVPIPDSLKGVLK